MAGEGVATRRGGRRDGDISGSDQGSRAGSVASQDDAIERLRAEAEQQRVAMEQQQLQHAKDVQELKAQLVAMAARPASTEVASGAEAARETSPPPPSSVSVVLGSLFAGRTDTTVHLRAEDFGVTADFLWLRLTEKGKRGLALRRVIRLPIDAELVCEGERSALPRVAQLARAYLEARREAHAAAQRPLSEYLFQLPGERRPTTTSMAAWLERLLERLQVRAPPSFAYLPHSIRSGTASAMAAIGIPRHIYVWIGGWSPTSTTVEKHYVDPTVLPTASALRLYGWARARAYTTDRPRWERRAPLPDPLLEEVAPLDGVDEEVALE